jgi:hypothetical protein
MARKRRLSVPIRSSEPVQFRYQTWTEWLKETFIRYWFAVIALLIDIFLSLEVMRHQELSFRVELAAIIFVVLLAVEITVYLFLWGKNGIWIFNEVEE